nr:hypothetical protein [Tanacetum cinerariifolium]
DKIILDTYGETVTLKRRRDDDEDKDEENGSLSNRNHQLWIVIGIRPCWLGASSRKYTTSVTKTKVADYGHIRWIKDLVPRTMWIQEPIDYDKHTLWGVSHWRRKRYQFYIFAVNRESARDVYSKRRIIAVTELKIVEWHSYKHLDWITNKDKKNRLMRIDELHKFSDGTLTDVRTALDDRLKGIRMRYLPQTIWRKSDKDRAVAMI